ncbi:MAG: hypothetical protein E7549_00170 [Ruminococcaceae bacterium]|nr:hypothetical protein [Oscillospiraceae bacterium]
MKFLRSVTVCLLLAAVLLSGCYAHKPSVMPPETADITPIKEGISLYGDVVETDLHNDILQVVQWQSGLDTASGDIFLYDRSAGTVCGQLTLPADAWATGCLDGGMYTVSLTSGTVTLYNTACKPRFSWKLDTAFAFAEVSTNGEWLLYGDGKTATVRLRRLKTGEEKELLSFSGHVASVGRRDGAFYLCCNTEELLRIDPSKEYAEALVVDNALHRFTPYYCVGKAEDGWHAVSADQPEKALNLPSAATGEELIAAGESGWFTTEGNTVRLYRPYADTACAAVDGRLLHAACTDTGALLVTTDGETLTVSRFTPHDGAVPPDTSTRTGTRFLLENVPVIPQNPTYPTGCESVSAVMALQYAGEDITVDEFIDGYLPQADSTLIKKDGRYYGPDPYEVFVGDPRTKSSYGCMSPVIKRAIDTHFGTDTRTVNTGGKSLEALCEQYVTEGIPVLTWVTIAMREVEYHTSWYLPNGERFTWPGNEHCMVLVGYDAEKYYFNDPYLGLRVAYDRTLAEDRYSAMGCQSLVILHT